MGSSKCLYDAINEQICLALGLTSALFMSGPNGEEIEMPSQELVEIANKTSSEILKIIQPEEK